MFEFIFNDGNHKYSIFNHIIYDITYCECRLWSVSSNNLKMKVVLRLRKTNQILHSFVKRECEYIFFI